MRLFVAIDLTDDARSAIVTVQKRVASELGSGAALRLVRPEHLHLTLVFIGEVFESQGPPIADRMAADIDHRPFDIVFGGVGVFPPQGAPRILWLGVTDGVGDATAVQQKVAERLEAIGVEREQRPFSPHLTLGRWRDSRPSEARCAVAQQFGTIARVPVASVTLYQSHLSSTGPTYTVLRRTPLVPTCLV